MTQQTINTGSAANDGTGDPLRTAFVKTNGNFTELYGADTLKADKTYVDTQDGLKVAKAGDTMTGALAISNTTASGSPTSGALTVAGGLGVGGAVNAGGGITAISAGGSGPIITSQDTRSSGATVSVAANFGGLGLPGLYTTGAFPLYLGTNASGRIGILATGEAVIYSTTPSSSPTTGALTVAGGLGVGGAAYVNDITSYSTSTPANGVYRFGNVAGKYLFYNGSTFFLSGGALGISDTTASTSPSSGALTVAGGLGCGGNIYCGGGGFKPAGGPWADSSDARIKTVVGDYEHGLAEVLQLAPKRYTYKGNDTTEPTTATKSPYESSPHYSVATDAIEYIGLIAQEVEASMPEMVSFSAGYIDGKTKVTDLRRLDTGALIYALINSVKELSARVQALEGG